jgi:ATP-binding cassette subfamily B protein
MDQWEEKDYSEEKINFKTWSKIIKVVLKSWKPLILMVMSVVVLTICDILFPIMNKFAIDNFFGRQDYTYAQPYIIAAIILAILLGLSIWSFILFAGRVEVKTSYELRRQAYAKLQELPFSYYDKTPMGWIMARMTSDSRRLANIIAWGLVDFIWSGLIMSTILVIIYFINWKLALIITVLVPVLSVIAIYIRKKLLKSYRDVRKVNSQITASFNEGFMGAKTTKSLVLEQHNREEFHDLTSKMRRNSIKAAIYSSLFWPMILLLGYIGVATTLYQGGIMVLEELILVGTLYLFIDFTLKFFEPIMQIARLLAEFQQAQASAERIVALIETEPDIFDTPEVKEKYGTIFKPIKENWEEIVGKVEFRNVTFKYDKGQTVLNTFNLSIEAGQNIAIVGETGSGKSTIVNLICRFYEPSEGMILIDDKNYKERSISWLHANLGYVLQSPHLFSGTIMENIRYGRLEATDEEVIEASKVVNAHTFITGLDNGYNTEVGEGGNKLSVGQKQLVSFARAVLANPKILILDEATSSIDTESEQIIQRAIEIILKGRTSVVIAHRLSTIINADKILVLRQGEVIEAGTHQELLNQRGAYFDLYKNQFMREMEEKLSHA